MYTVLVITHVLVSVALIGLVLIQHGKGADAGAAFGSGASGTVFGARGSANFLTRATSWLATGFFVLSMALAYIVHGRGSSGSVTDALTAAPATGTAAPTPAPIPEGTPPAVTPPATPDPSKPDGAPKVPK